MFISLGLWAGYSRYRANTNLPTYHTSSKTLFIPFEISSLVIYKMTLVASGLFMTSKSIILQNISWVISWAFISMNLRWRARISIRTGGEFVTYGIISLILIKKSWLRWLRYSRGLVQNLNSWSGLYWSWLLLLAAIDCITLISSETSFGNFPSLYLDMNWSISLISSGSEEKLLLLWKRQIRLKHSFFEESIVLNQIQRVVITNTDYEIMNRSKERNIWGKEQCLFVFGFFWNKWGGLSIIRILLKRV